ncbi:OpgC family protein [Xinfangfangia pollutisoli]|uniref:OpgC family protein n=1 Tax=Xinfangfangia pollutisoli TaxID=2865960 RepID=UPI0021E5C9A4|nr:OpgC domain-containing protein [Xinfangfangia pollutisoli]
MDFFRGLALIIILVNHLTDNPWALWTPSRFGFSDATEIFVFCSGLASALAFGAVFARAGMLLGTARVLYRVWQVYWVHIGLFFCGLLAMLVLNQSGWFPRDEVGALNLYPFLRNTGPNLIGLFTLTYVPNYFDVLPMYIGILAMIPAFVLVARIDVKLAFLCSLTLWAVAQAGWLDLPAEWWFANGSTRTWFFNPFAWQLVFFTGFALASGWLPAPPQRADLAWAAVAVVLLTVPFAWHVSIGSFEFVRNWRSDWVILHDKTHFGLLRYVHFLALAYLAWVVVGPAGARLTAGPLRRRVTAVVALIGTQSLAVFAMSMVLARVLGAVLRLYEFSFAATVAVNLLGVLGLVLTAWATGWIKSAPWKAAMRQSGGTHAASAALARQDLAEAPAGAPVPARVEVKA